MRRLKSETTAPPDFYRYTVPETGYRIEAVDSSTWEDKTRAHLTANGIPIPDNLRAIMQDQLCASLPPEYCEYHDGKWVDLRLDWADIVRGTKALVLAAVGGFVHQEEAERRANICRSCPFNVRVGSCTACKASKYLIGEIAKKSTSNDAKLLNCGVCKCSLLAAVHVPLDVLTSTDDPAHRELYPIEWCWKREGSVNYKA